jgi:hypothetical protein
MKTMELQTFTNLIKDSNIISKKNLEELKKISVEYPYFQSAQVLLLKGLKQNCSFEYNDTLKKTASVTIDRSILFECINQLSRSNSNINKRVKKTKDKAKLSTQRNLEIGMPLEFDQNEAYSFNQWLQLTNKKPIVRKPNTKTSLFKNKDLINRFIQNNPTINPISKDSQNGSSIENAYPERELMTETLAKVYLEQKKFNNAIKAYEILILKYPEKSGFFANQIKKIEHLKNK